VTRLPLLATVALSLTLMCAAPAGATTVLGQTVTPSAPSACSGFPDFEIVQESRGGVSSAAPAAGVITSWSFLAGPSASNIELRVFHKLTATDTWQPVTAAGTLQTVAADSGLHVYPTRVPIAAGDFVGLHTAGGGCYANTPSGDVARYYYETSPQPVGTAASYNSISAIVDLAAAVEPDADHDGYGDETQDSCPTKSSTQLPCPPNPDTVITKKPTKKTSHKAKSKIFFTATPPAQAFMCQLDKGSVKECTSPAVFKCLDPGKHQFRVYGLNSSTSLDTTPAVAKWRVREPRKGC
jgi:hypothetical protein